jgi:hypothetical protein
MTTPQFTDGYAPTPQEYGKFRQVRGNPPLGIGNASWIRAYNSEDSVWRKRFKWDPLQAAHIREAGLIRAEAIKRMIKSGRLPADFVDSNP